jgi:hypothetical protein
MAIETDHPLLAVRAFTTPGRRPGGFSGTGTVVGVVQTKKGNFVEIQDAAGRVRKVRPGCLHAVA